MLRIAAISPVGHFLRRRHFACFPFHRLAYRQGNARAGLGNIFAQHQHRIVGIRYRAASGYGSRLRSTLSIICRARLFAFSYAGIEVFATDQLTQARSCFQCWRAENRYQ